MEQLEADVVKDQFNTVILGIFVIIGLCFIPACFVVYLVEERITKSKHLQFVSGVNPTIFWLSCYTWDFLSFIFSIILLLGVFFIFQEKAFVGPGNIGCLITLLVLFSTAIIPLMYLASFWFKEPATAFVLVIVVNFFIGSLTTITTFVIDLVDSTTSLELANEVLKIFFLIFPQYCLGRGIFEMALNQAKTDFRNKVGSSSRWRIPEVRPAITLLIFFQDLDGILREQSRKVNKI